LPKVSHGKITWGERIKTAEKEESTRKKFSGKKEKLKTTEKGGKSPGPFETFPR